MRWFDTHCHLDRPPLSESLDGVLERACQAGIEAVIVPGVSGAVNPFRLPAWAGKAWGVHPEKSLEWVPQGILKAFERCPYPPRAIGECGLDVHLEIPFDRQAAIFEAQIRLAVGRQLPLLIHLRGYWEDALRLLRTHGSGVPWVMHSFSGSAEIARAFLKEGAFISFSGSLCHANARKTPEVGRLVPDDRLLLETDAPDLKPPSWKGSWNEPAALPDIARKLAEIRNCRREKIAGLSWENACRIFSWP